MSLSDKMLMMTIPIAEVRKAVKRVVARVKDEACSDDEVVEIINEEFGEELT